MRAELREDQVANLLHAKRINVVGTSGTGKTTFARALSRIRGVPCIEMDALYWGPNWSARDEGEFRRRLETALQEDEWILDGNYTRTIPIKWAAADCVIWLDLGFPTTMLRAIRRAVRRCITREELWEGTGNRESFRQTFFSRDSMILWTLRTHAPTRRKYSALMSGRQHEHIAFLQIRSPKEADRLITTLTTRRRDQGPTA